MIFTLQSSHKVLQITKGPLMYNHWVQLQLTLANCDSIVCKEHLLLFI
jgi:hypothetical protein